MEGGDGILRLGCEMEGGDEVGIWVGWGGKVREFGDFYFVKIKNNKTLCPLKSSISFCISLTHLFTLNSSISFPLFHSSYSQFLFPSPYLSHRSLFPFASRVRTGSHGNQREADTRARPLGATWSDRPEKGGGLCGRDTTLKGCATTSKRRWRWWWGGGSVGLWENPNLRYKSKQSHLIEFNCFKILKFILIIGNQNREVEKWRWSTK